MPIDPRRIEVIDDATAEILRRMTPAQKLEIANQMVIQGREMIRSIVRSQNPEWSVERVEEEVRRRMTSGGLDELPGLCDAVHSRAREAGISIQ